MIETHFGTQLDMTPRYVPDTLMQHAHGIGERPVTGLRFRPPGAHAVPAIKRDWGVVEADLACGCRRAFGCVRAYIDSHLRMVVVGTPVRDEVRMAWPEADDA